MQRTQQGEPLGKMTGKVKHVVTREHHTFEKECIRCRGTGEVKLVKEHPNLIEPEDQMEACPACNGRGMIEQRPFNYGFIIPDDHELNDVFVHHRDIEPWREGFKELAEGDRVEFDLFKTFKGLQARNVAISREISKGETNE